MNIKVFKEWFDPLFLSYIQSKQAGLSSLTEDPYLKTLFEHIPYIAQGGKRIRPCITSYIYTSSVDKRAPIEDILIAIELFHVFCLVHDDIMDHAHTRHGVKTVHTLTEEILKKETSDTSHIGISQAILIGDILFNWVNERLEQQSWGDEDSRQAVRSVFRTLVDEVCVGQMLDINLLAYQKPTDELIATKNRFKTARYSFSRPIHIGLILGKKEHLVPTALLFGEYVGSIYQIQDDIADIFAEHTNKDPMRDVREGQPTLLSNYVYTHAQDKDKQFMLSLRGKDTITPDEQQEVRRIYKESGAHAHGLTNIEMLEKQTQSLLEQADMSPTERDMFTTIAKLVTNNI